jgi:hypothetical protein
LTILGFFGVSKFLNSINESKATKDPLGAVIAKQKDTPLFTVLLFDMEKNGFLSKTYRHQYRVIKEVNGKIVAKETAWYQVPSSYFWQHENSLGMEVAAKDSTGKIHRTVTPPGYTNYVGNPKYGGWGNMTTPYVSNLTERVVPRPTSSNPDGTTTVLDTTFSYVMPGAAPSDPKYYWNFYPKYKYIRPLLQIPAGKIYKKDHQTARNYHNRGIVYYGAMTVLGRRRYGTYSNQTNTFGRTKRWSRGGGGGGK